MMKTSSLPGAIRLRREKVWTISTSLAIFLSTYMRHQFGLVEAGLELVGHQHHPVFRAIKGKAQILPFTSGSCCPR
jgi:hypothetical protein